MDSSEQTWLERALRDAVLRGDEAAWREIHDRHFQPLYSYVHFRTGRRTDRTEDAVQECWMTVVRRLSAFDPGRGTFEAWLRGIANNVLRSHARRASRQAEHERQALGLQPERTGSAPDSQDLAEQIAWTLSELPCAYQDILRAKYEQELPVATIAASWKKPPKAIESMLSRARAAFREAFSRRRKGS